MPSARTVREVARHLARKGMLRPEQLEAILEAHPASDAPGAGQTILRAVAGVLLASAVFALFALLDLSMEDGLAMCLGFTTVFLAAHLALDLKGFRGWSATPGVAALVLGTFGSVFGSVEQILPVTSFLLGAIVVAATIWRNGNTITLGLLGIVAALIQSAVWWVDLLDRLATDSDFMLTLVFIHLLILVPLNLLWAFYRKQEWPIIQAVSIFGLVPGLVMFLIEVFDGANFDGAISLSLLFIQLLVVLIAYATKQSGFLLGGAIVASGAAIVFSFEVGGLLFGILVLVGISIGLLFLTKLMPRFQEA